MRGRRADQPLCPGAHTRATRRSGVLNPRRSSSEDHPNTALRRLTQFSWSRVVSLNAKWRLVIKIKCMRQVKKINKVVLQPSTHLPTWPGSWYTYCTNITKQPEYVHWSLICWTRVKKYHLEISRRWKAILVRKHLPKNLWFSWDL